MLPSWLAQIGQGFANNPANGFKATLGDVMQGIGHSMMENYRRDMTPSGSQTGGVPGGSPLLGLLGSSISPMGILGKQMGLGAAPQAPPPMMADEKMNLSMPSAVPAPQSQGPQYGATPLSLPLSSVLQLFK